jgi:MoaA/NifB/PqqE/SkfB family radical SAM enzyme
MLEVPVKVIRDLEKLGINNIPKTVFWAIISYCNAVCTTCNFYQVPMTSRKYVKFEDARKAIEILYNSGFRMTSITGGEPLMNPDIFKICNYLNTKGIIITYMPTNGILVTKETAKQIKQADIRLVGISIDIDDGKGMGLTRKIPDLRQVVMRAREYLEDAGVKTYAGLVLTRSTLDIAKIVDMALDMGFKRVIFSYPQTLQSSSYLASAEIHELVLDLDQIQNAVDAIKIAKKTSGVSIHNPNISLDELVRFYKGVPRKFKCHGGSKLFYLDWNLDLYRCFTLPKKYGNLLELDRIDFEEELCDLCTQQAFRDHDPFYYLAAKISEMKKHPLSAPRLLLNQDTRQALGALSELLSGGFV